MLLLNIMVSRWLNFNPIIGLILILSISTETGAGISFQSHYRSDFNFGSTVTIGTVGKISIPL